MSAIDMKALVERIQVLEDRQEITQLLMTHPLSIDGGATEFWLENWTDDAVVDRLVDPERHSGDYGGVYGKDVMRLSADSPELEALRKSGVCHFVTLPAIRLEGDSAHATNYCQLIGLEGQAYRFRRILVSRWELRRVSGTWKISKRTIRPIGHEEARPLVIASLPLQRG